MAGAENSIIVWTIKKKEATILLLFTTEGSVAEPVQPKRPKGVYDAEGSRHNLRLTTQPGAGKHRIAKGTATERTTELWRDAILLYRLKHQ